MSSPAPHAPDASRSAALARVLALYEDYFIQIEDPDSPEAALFNAAAASDWDGALRACSRGADPLARAFDQSPHNIGEAVFFAQELSALALAPELMARRPIARPLSALIAAALLGDEPLARRLAPLADPFAPAGPAETSAFDACARSNLHGLIAELLPQAIKALSPQELESALLHAAEQPAIDACSLLAPLCDPAAADESGRTALMVAAAGSGSSQRALFERLLIALLPHSDARLRDRNGQTALMLAAHQGSARACRLLLPHSDPRDRDLKGFTALMLAAQAASPRRVAALLPASPARWLNFKSQSALALAAGQPSRSASECVRQLAPASDIRMEDAYEKNALALAIDADNPLSVALLITPESAGAPLVDGLPPLAYAARRGAARCVAPLLPLSEPAWRAPGPLARGGQISAMMIALRNRNLLCAIALLPAFEPFEAELGQTLLAHLLSLEPDDYPAESSDGSHAALLDAALALWGDRPLPPEASAEFHLALCRGHDGWARRLFPAANPRHRDPHTGETALMAAAKSAMGPWVERLIPLSDPGARSRDGSSALMMAAMSGCAASVRLLLPCSDPSLANDYGLNPLGLAASNDHFECAELLLPHCDPFLRSWRGESPFFKALDSGDERIIRLLAPYAQPGETDLLGRDAFDALLSGNALERDPGESRWSAMRRLGLLVASCLPRPPDSLQERPLADRLINAFHSHPWDAPSREEIEGLALAMAELCELRLGPAPAPQPDPPAKARRL